jgi:hypothetical protein
MPAHQTWLSMCTDMSVKQVFIPGVNSKPCFSIKLSSHNLSKKLLLPPHKAPAHAPNLGKSLTHTPGSIILSAILKATKL